MNRSRIVFGVCLALFVALCSLIYGNYRQYATTGVDYTDWPPGPGAIRAKLGTVYSPLPGMTDAQRREQFCELFKARFRQHEPPVAVGLRFDSPNRIKLMCPARLEPFFVDRIALAAWREAGDLFGQPMEVDIYDTFIGTNQVKIGQLRVSRSHPRRAVIDYDFRHLEAMSRPRASGPRAGIPMRSLRLRDLPADALNPPRRPAL